MISPPVQDESKFKNDLDLSKARALLKGRLVSCVPEGVDRISNGGCPECGTGPQFQAHHESCMMCVSCGYTKC